MQLPRLIAKSTAIASIFYSLLAMAPGSYFPNLVHAQESAIVGSKEHPLSLPLSSLDNSWRKFKISGQYEFGDLIQQWVSFLGTSSANNIYFTQGKMVKMGGRNYLVAYRIPPAAKTGNAQESFMSMAWGGGTSPECANLEAMEAQVLTMDSRMSLALLNPDTIGSLNDIEVVNVEAEIEASTTQFKELKKGCEEAKSEAALAEAQQYMSLINSGQEAIFYETKKFAPSVAALQYGVPDETENYTYSLTTQTSTYSAAQAIAKSEFGLNVTGAVASVTYPGETSPSMIAIICKSTEAGKLPNPPVFDANTQSLSCAEGTEEFFWY